MPELPRRRWLARTFGRCARKQQIANRKSFVPRPVSLEDRTMPATAIAASGLSAVFIDARVPDIQRLIAGVAPGERVFVLDVNRDRVL
jgi:hypothetical protein